MSKEKNIAAIDLGSHSVIMLVARCSEGKTVPINEYFAVTRLGEKSSASRMLSQDAMDRTIKAAVEMQEYARQDAVFHTIVTATSAVRNADNKSKFLVKCHQQLKIYPQVLSGREEASLTFLGATNAMQENSPVVLVDIGGGSTEIAWGTKEKMEGAHSIEIGCVKLAETFGISEKLTLPRQFAAQLSIRRALLPYKYEIGDWAIQNRPTILISGGTATTLAAMLKRFPIYNRDMIHLSSASRKDVADKLTAIGKMDIASRRRVVGMDPDRAPAMPAGLLILQTVLSFFSFDKFLVSTDGLRLGTILYYLRNIQSP
jgi:exopolyphosphatase/guanosine-5'-triphosphate,3'-diphosphate pyrophosphatase